MLPLEDRTNDDTLTHIDGQDIEEHVHRPKTVRDELLTHFRSMDIHDWRKPGSLEPYDVTPEWVIYHHIEHESHRRGEIFQILSILKNSKSNL